jgi:hypothetical protein
VGDKIAASKRKRIWVGGPVPLGYRSVGKKLEIVPEDAALVRASAGSASWPPRSNKKTSGQDAMLKVVQQRTSRKVD